MSERDGVRALLTPTEASAALRVSRATLYRMVKRGDIEVVRLSGRDAATIRIPVRAIERLAGGKDAAVLTLGVGADVERPPVAGEEPDPRRRPATWPTPSTVIFPTP